VKARREQKADAGLADAFGGLFGAEFKADAGGLQHIGAAALA